MAIELVVGRDNSGADAYSRNLADTADSFSVLMSANTDYTFAVPSGCNRAFITAGSGVDYWVGSSAVSLPGGTIAAADRHLNPQLISVSSGQSLHINSKTGGEIGVEFYHMGS